VRNLTVAMAQGVYFFAIKNLPILSFSNRTAMFCCGKNIKAYLLCKSMKFATGYYESAIGLLKSLRETQLAEIDRAAAICVQSIRQGGLVFLFGAGHSRMMCEEMTPRQGCFVGFYSLVEQSLSNHSATIGVNGLRAPLYLEKYEGYAEEILKGFHFGPNDAFILISTSGIRPIMVEMGLGAKKRNLPVIAIVSRQHCEQAKPTHSSGKKLIEVADVVIDNQSPPGDCVYDLEGLPWRTGPTSTVTGAMIINMLRCEVAGRLLEVGHEPVLLPSHQFVNKEGVTEQMERYYESYRKSLAHLYS
jgi:uncharacterized phosphosugar-binding protein